jgi:ribosome-associated toxin RatA of RatAB toxin-antitoxin module
MKSVHKSVLIWYSAQEMFSLVAQVADYPKFLPWCDRATVLSEDDQGMTAQIGISFGGIHQTFTTRNAHEANGRIGMQLVDGPFSNLDGEWLFLAVGDAAQRACRVELKLRYGFDNAALATLVGPVFDKIAGSLVDAFVKRAEHVYG